MKDAAANKDQAGDFTPWKLIGEPRLLTGFGYGFSYPSVFLKVQLPDISSAERADLSARFDGFFDKIEGIKPLAPLDEGTGPAGGIPQGAIATARWFALIASRLVLRAGLPVVQPARVVRASSDACTIAAPTLTRGLAPLAGLLKLALETFRTDPAAPNFAELRALAERQMQQLLAANLTTSNTPRLVKAAVERGVAFQELVGTNVVQYGLGRKSAIFDSTFTQRTPTISARLARHKHEAAAMLRRHRLPVPDHALVADEAQAIAAAEMLGYPVVVKPADQDGGLAVQAGLQSRQELVEAFALAQRVSKKILVERHAPGRDYRLTVFHDRCVWAVERQPAGVTGDGLSTISQLVEAANAEPGRGSGPHSPLKLLKIDSEALGILATEGFTADGIPKEGQFVRLRRASNVSSGGMPVAVFDTMHPDNARLAVRAARALKLDLAGVDLIIPDLAVSWKESGAAICEVNAQPELGGVTSNHLYPQILKGFLGGNGHIPTVAILGGQQAETISQELSDHLLGKGMLAGLHNRRGISIGADVIEEGFIPQISAGAMLAGNQSVDALIFGATNFGVAFHGLPVPRIDVLLITGEAIEQGVAAGLPPRAQAVQSLQALRGNCSSVLMLETEEGIDANLAFALDSIGLNPHRLPRDGIARAIADRL